MCIHIFTHFGKSYKDIKSMVIYIQKCQKNLLVKYAKGNIHLRNPYVIIRGLNTK
jgi:hypothetical protein